MGIGGGGNRAVGNTTNLKKSESNLLIFLFFNNKYVKPHELFKLHFLAPTSHCLSAANIGYSLAVKHCSTSPSPGMPATSIWNQVPERKEGRLSAVWVLLPRQGSDAQRQCHRVLSCSSEAAGAGAQGIHQCLWFCICVCSQQRPSGSAGKGEGALAACACVL